MPSHPQHLYYYIILGGYYKEKKHGKMGTVLFFEIRGREQKKTEPSPFCPYQFPLTPFVQAV
jgi:hypothetical protein